MTTTRVFEINEAIEILSRTPLVLQGLLGGLDEAWTVAREGEGTWSPQDVVAHLIECERTDWIVRAAMTLEQDRPTYESFDPRGHEAWVSGRSMESLLGELSERRAENLETLRGWALSDAELDRPAMHPELGPAQLRELLAAWVVHDMHHIGQVVRVMAKRYGPEAGVWAKYLTILRR